MTGAFLQLVETPDNRKPAGAELHSVRTSDGVVLRAMFAPSPLGASAAGTVVLMGGRADFLERYYETAKDLQRRGFAVVCFDWRGQGGSQRLLSDPLRGYVSSFRQYDEDLRSVMEQVVKKFGAKPYYAIGHSTGGHILLRAVRGRTDFARAVVTAPLIDFNYGAWPPALANFIASCALALGLKGLYLPGHKHGPLLLKEDRDNPFTSDMRRWQRDRNVLGHTPQLGLGGPTFGWFHAAWRSVKKLQGSSAKGVACPVLMVLAGRERVVSLRAAQAYAENTPGVSQVIIREALHEILVEADAIRAQFFAALDAFLTP